MAARKRGKDHRATDGERLALSSKQARGGPHRVVDGIDHRTSSMNLDSAMDTRRDGSPGRGGSEQGGMAGPVGYFEGEGNEGPFAPLGGALGKSTADSQANGQGGVASGAPG